MRARRLTICLAIAGAAALGGQTLGSPDQAGAATAKSRTQEILSGWGAKPKEVAQTIIGKYGEPDEATPSMLVWNNRGPWKRTVVYGEEVPHDFPKPHTDIVEQFIDYRVPTDKYDDLANYDGSVIVERTKGEISARCDKEEMNFLALNLAHDVATGKKSVDVARRTYAETAMAFMDGKKSPLVEKLQFNVASSGTADRDKPFKP